VSSSRPRATRAARTARAAAPAAAVRPPDAVYDRIRAAILEHRLPPGTQLVEERLAEIFTLSRARVREALARLAHERMVALVPQRGAHVARPDAEETTQVFAARRLIEPELVRRLVRHPSPDAVAQLQAHHAQELAARRRDDRNAIVRLSGEFHTLLADLAGNAPLARAMRELSSLTCLAIYLYDAPTSTSCRADDHGDLLQAIARGDAAAAERLMVHHLEHIEASLRLRAPPGEVDLAQVLGQVDA
jgi:DNA-binding GntR family transcriptional regulator